MIFKDINETINLRLAQHNDNSLSIAKKALDNEIVILNGWKYIKFNNDIDWNYGSSTNNNTYLLYLNTLDVVGYLSTAFEMTKDEIYIKKAEEIITSWINYEKSGNLNKMVWYDHTVSFRAQNILHFYLVAKETVELDKEEYENLIMKHINYLYDDSNYELYNHGVMIDKSLLACATAIEDEISQQLKFKALYRLKENFYINFSSKGVHLENSLYYHYFVIKMYAEIDDFLNKIGLSLGKNILYCFERSKKYLNYAAKPNGELPQIGDGIKFTLDNKENKYFENFFDYDAGIAYLQYKDEHNSMNSTYISFVCGYSTKTHKHYDDLSFTLYYGGKDIFIDSGHFGYGNTKERKYLISQQAHSTFFIEEENYNLIDVDKAFDKIKITDYISNKNYSIIKGKNNSYTDTQMYRTIILFNPNIIFIYDKGISNTDKTYTQLYNLAPNNEIKYLDDKTCKINDNIEIFQINNSFIYEHINANPEEPKAVISETLEKLINTSQVSFKRKCSNISILTLISLDNSKNNINNMSFDEINEILNVTINNISYSIVL